VALLIRAKAILILKIIQGNSAIEYALLADDDKLIEISKLNGHEKLDFNFTLFYSFISAQIFTTGRLNCLILPA
jgi:hypothetical protein